MKHSKSRWPLIMLSLSLLAGCASAPPSKEVDDPTARETAIFVCKQQMQTKKKARFNELPKVLQRLLGENRILKIFDGAPNRRDIQRAIAKSPLEGDSGDTWRSEKDASHRTVSARTEYTRSGDEVLGLVFGQPGRSYVFPLAALKRAGFGPAFQGGVRGKTDREEIQIRVVDEHHVLIMATIDSAKAADRMKDEPADRPTRFDPQNMFALVRTYLEQSYSQESATVLSDYPIELKGLDEESCDQLTAPGAPLSFLYQPSKSTASNTTSATR